MAKKTGKVNVGDIDINADWIKIGKGHKLEAQIHEELARRYRKRKANQKAKGKEGTAQTGADQNDAPKEAKS